MRRPRLAVRKNLFDREEHSRCIFCGRQSLEGKLRVKGIAVEVKPNRPAARFRSAGIGSTKLDGVNLPGRFRVEPNVPFATSTDHGVSCPYSYQLALVNRKDKGFPAANYISRIVSELRAY